MSRVEGNAKMFFNLTNDRYRTNLLSRLRNYSYFTFLLFMPLRRKKIFNHGCAEVTPAINYFPFLPLILRPIARRKFSMRTSVFLISVEKTSLPTMGQKGTCAMTEKV
jgi:hypothetical protein